MTKNFATLYASTNDSISLEQKFYIKEETTKGTFIAAVGADLIKTLSGGQISLSQALNSSPHRSGRHHTGVIADKKVTEWNFSTFVNIDTGVAAGTTELDAGLRALHKSMWGKEDTTGTGVVYTSGDDPNTSFTIMEVGDFWAKQAPGSFVNSVTLNFPGDGQSQFDWSGNSKTMFLVGIGKTTTNNNAGNTITLQTGEGKRFPAGCFIQAIEADGISRSADIADGSPRKVTSVAGDVLTVDGAVLADMDGSLADIYITYYEPDSPTAIDEPQIGLVGSITIASLSSLSCVRSIVLTANNNHELVDYCFGSDELDLPLFVPGDRLTVEVALELNLNHDLVEFINKKLDFTGENIDIFLGDVTTRHLKVDLPKAIFNVPPIPVPETGSIPVSFDGIAYQTALDAADEITVSYL